MTGGYKELQTVTRGCIRLQRAYRELERVTGGYRKYRIMGVTRA